jgi:O-antigen ligase
MLYLLVTAIMIIRPTDFIPELNSVSLYALAIVPCILLSWHKLVPQLTTAGLRERPVLLFGIGIVLVSLVSNFVHGQGQIGVDSSVELVKVLILYLLLLAHLDSLARLRFFLGFLVFVILVPILLAVLNFHDVVKIPGFRVLDGADGIRRLEATGNFGDPNDVCEIVNCAIIFCLCGLLDRARGFIRVLWLAPLVLFGHALYLTNSRGGFLAAVVGVMALLWSRFRGTKSLVLGGAAVALMFVLFAGRQTTLSTSEGTGQSRIQLWDDGFQMLRHSPLIGVGTNQFAKNVGHVAHNAFVQTYAELGLLAGTLLFGQYYWCLKNTLTLGSRHVKVCDLQVRGLHPFVLAYAASFATSEMSLTNQFSVLTYLMFGLATVCIRLADPSPPPSDLLMNGRLICRVIVFGSLFLAGLYVFTRLNLRYG